MSNSRYYVGLDLGQAADYTALCIVERVPSALHVRHLERFPLRTPYPAIVDRVAELVRSPKLKGGALLPALVVDHTGVGRAVVDQIGQRGLSPIAVTITGGDTVSHEGNLYRVPKKDLVSTIQVLFDADRLAIAPDLSMARVLIQELQNFKVKITAAANVTFEAWREGQHDDMVLAVALACWYAESGHSRLPSAMWVDL